MERRRNRRYVHRGIVECIVKRNVLLPHIHSIDIHRCKEVLKNKFNMIGKEDKVLLIYHKDDNDGVYSAALIYRYLEEKLHVEKENIYPFGADYNKLDSIKKEIKSWKEKYTSVIMTDISFNDWRAMSKLCKLFEGKFIWIDHHGPAIRQSVEHGYDKACGIRETWTSAIGLAYEWLWDPLRVKKSSTSMPNILQYLAGWDSWNPSAYGIQDMDECMAINLAVNMDTHLSLSRAIYEVNDMMYSDGSESDSGRKSFYDLQENGQTILEYQKAQWAEIMKFADREWKVWDPFNKTYRTAAAIYYTGPTTSKMFESIKDDVQIGIAIKWTGKRFLINIYNLKTEYNKEFNCGLICSKFYKGGGHPGAASLGNIFNYQTKKILSTKCIK